MAKLIFNFELLKSGFPAIIIEKENQYDYLTTIVNHLDIQSPHYRSYTPFIQLISRLTLQEMNTISDQFSFVAGDTFIPLNNYPPTSPPLNNEPHNLTSLDIFDRPLDIPPPSNRK